MRLSTAVEKAKRMLANPNRDGDVVEIVRRPPRSAVPGLGRTGPRGPRRDPWARLEVGRDRFIGVDGIVLAILPSDFEWDYEVRW